MSISRYRDLLSAPGVGTLLGSSILARAFTGMTSLAMLLLVTQDHGYDVAGLVTGASVIGSVVTGPAVARLADRVGRRLVLLVCSVTYTGSLVALALLPPEPLLLTAVATVGGATTPPVMAALRAAVAALTSPEQRLTAFSLDSTLQEIVLVVGPMVTTMLVALAGPQAALIGSGVLTLIGTLLYCGQRAAEAGRPQRVPRRRSGAEGSAAESTPRPPKGRLAGPGFIMMMGAASALLAGLVMVNLAAVAGAGGPDAPTASAVMLACVAAGSGVGGLVFGARAKGRAALALFPGGVALGAVLLSTAPNTAVLAVLLLLFGTMVAPALTMLYDGLTRRASATRATEAFAWLASATGVGGAVGNMAGGTVVEHFGSRGGFLVAAAALAVCAGICSLPVLRRPAIRPEPVSPSAVAGAAQAP